MLYPRRLVRTVPVLLGMLLVAVSASANWKDGVSAFQQENYRRAINRLEATLRDEPNDARAHYLLGLAFAHEGRKREALDQLQAALDPSAVGLDPAVRNQLQNDQRIVRRTKAAKLADKAADLGEGFRETLDRPAIERPARPR